MDTRHVEEIGRALGVRLAKYRAEHPIVLGLTPGGVPIAQAIAQWLGGGFDIVQAESLVSGGYRGAVAETGEIVLDSGSADDGAEQEFAGRIVQCLSYMLAQRVQFLPGCALPEVLGRVVIVVADVVSSGARMRAALTSLRDRGAVRLVAVAMAGTDRAVELLQPLADEVVCLMTHPRISGVGRNLRGWKRIPRNAAFRLLRRETGRKGPRRAAVTH
ncbi:MAG: phosphoribosyltransferase family protein [Planctomycetota bacterium]